MGQIKWTYTERPLHQLPYDEALEIYDLFDFETNFPNYGKVNMRVFMNIMRESECFELYSDGQIALLQYFEPCEDDACKFHFAVLRPELIKNRGYFKYFKEILASLLDKEQDVCYKCIYGYTQSKETERFGKLFGFKVLSRENGITKLIKE